MDSNKKPTKIIVSSITDDNFCKCQYCGVVIANIISDKMVPSPEECYSNGNVPVPNFGWFCSQDCANKYETEYDIKFARTEEGKVDYYKTNPNN